MHPAQPIERDAIVRALREAGGDVGRAAGLLGASRRTLQYRMREYGMPRGHAGRPRRRLSRRWHRSRLGAGALAIGGALVGALVYATVKHRGSSSV